MATIWKFTKFVLILVVFALVLWGVFANYSVIFSRTVVGEVMSVERVELPIALMTRPGMNITPQAFSFAIGIKESETGEIVTASAEDRQWAVVQPGQCAEAVFLPYPPWHFTKKGTYFGARLLRLYECPKK